MVLTTTTLKLALVLMTTLSTTDGLGRRGHQLNRSNAQLLQTLRTMRRGDNQCLAGGNRCFNSGECCLGFVCAAFDDFSGENPDVPGFCVREKELQSCETDDECKGLQSICSPFGDVGQRYCITEPLRNEINPLSSLHAPPRKFNPGYYATSGRLGSPCNVSNDCNAITEGSNAPLCCKDVRRARQGVKRMCDKVETPSPCI